VSYQLDSINSSNASTEILVIQTVIKREEIKSFIEKRLASHEAYCERGAIDPETFDLIHQLQFATIICVETIEKWRLQLTRPYPFHWKQQNYVRAMARDLDFVYFSSAMKKYLRRGSKKNPFLVPKIQLEEMYQLLTTVLVPRSGNPDISNEKRRLNAMMKKFAPNVPPLRLYDAIKLIIGEEKTWGPADGVMVAPVWASEAKEAKERLLGGGKGGRKAPMKRKALLGDKKENKLDPKKRYKRFNPFKIRPQFVWSPPEMPSKKTKKKKVSKAKLFCIGLRVAGRYMLLTAKDIGAGRTAITAYDMLNNAYHELEVRKSDLRQAVNGQPGSREFVRIKRSRFLFVFNSLVFTPTYSLSVDYKIGVHKFFKKPNARPPSVKHPNRWTFAKKIGSHWVSVLCSAPQTFNYFKIKIFPIKYPQISQRLTIHEAIVQTIKDSPGGASGKVVDPVAILKIILLECIICAGSPPIFFVQDPFTSRPNTRVRAQMEQVEAGIPFDSRPSTRSIFTPTLLQSVPMPEDGLLHIQPNVQALLDADLYAAKSVDTLEPTTSRRERYRQSGRRAEASTDTSNPENFAQRYDYINTAPIVDKYFARTIYRGEMGMYVMQLSSTVMGGNNFVQLSLYPVTRNIHNSTRSMTLQFDRLMIEKLYARDSRYDFSEGQDGLISLSKVLRNHIKINDIDGANSKLSLVDLQILLPTPNNENIKSLPSIHGAPGKKIKRDPAKKEKQPRNRRAKSKQANAATTIMPIFKPVIERQISAEGHKRVKRPYTAKTHRDRQHYAKVFLQNLVIKAQIQIANEISDVHNAKQQAARFWLRDKARAAKMHINRQTKAKSFLLSFVTAERENLHKKILKQATVAKVMPGASTSIMTISLTKRE
jgi:hypothetical protein